MRLKANDPALLDYYHVLTHPQLVMMCAALAEESDRKSGELMDSRGEYVRLLWDVCGLQPGAMVTAHARDAARKLAALGKRCPECGASDADIRKMVYEDGAVYRCEDCSHDWPVNDRGTP